MNMSNFMSRRRKRKGFSLVELVVVILIIAILAVAVFAGGSAVIKKSQISRTISDLHNFSVQIESFLNSNPNIANLTGTTDFNAIDSTLISALNADLPEDYQLTEKVQGLSGDIASVDTNTNVAIYKSAKTDAWDNNYYVIMDSGERHGTNNSDFYVYVVSAGPDAKTTLAGAIGGGNAAKADDIFLLAQYENGDVTAVTYNMAKDIDNLHIGKNGGMDTAIAKGHALYCLTTAVDTGLAENCPVNF